jgi:hypothetical protein
MDACYVCMRLRNVKTNEALYSISYQTHYPHTSIMHKDNLLNIGLFTLHSSRTPIYWRRNIVTVKRHTKIAGKITLKPEQFNLNENTGQ